MSGAIERQMWFAVAMTFFYILSVQSEDSCTVKTTVTRPVLWVTYDQDQEHEESASVLSATKSQCFETCARAKNCNYALYTAVPGTCKLLKDISSSLFGFARTLKIAPYCARDRDSVTPLYRKAVSGFIDYNEEDIYRRVIGRSNFECLTTCIGSSDCTDALYEWDIGTNQSGICILLKRQDLSWTVSDNTTEAGKRISYVGFHEVPKNVAPNVCDLRNPAVFNASQDSDLIFEVKTESVCQNQHGGCWLNGVCQRFLVITEKDADGQCIVYPVIKEEINYKDEQRCVHTKQEACSQTYQTVFKNSKVQDCQESFVKDCFIEYESVPKSRKIQICKEPLIRDCEIEGEETCSTEFETICETTFHEAQVQDDVAVCEMVDLPNGQGRRHQCRIEQVASTKLIPETDCHQKNMTVCGSESCPIVKGERVCIDELKTFVEEVPKERCHLNPKKICNEVNKVIPKLELTTECIDVPKELCETVQVEVERFQVEVNRTVCTP